MKRLPFLIFSLLLYCFSHYALAENPHITVAGGCFWCVQSDFDKAPGVIKTVAGYTGGKQSTATYDQVSSGKTNHLEAAQIFYDPNKTSFKKLAWYFWKHVDPTDGDGQFCDRGAQYRPVIFFQNEQQKQIAEQIKQAVAKKLQIQDMVAIRREKPFYLAEKYHQDYYKKNPIRYRYYRWRCGRDDRVEKVWGE